MSSSYALHNSNKQTTSRTPAKPVAIKHAESVKTVLRAKLKTGQPNDKYEQEADRVAEQVMRMPAPQLTSSAGNVPLQNSSAQFGETVQRLCQTCAEEKELIQEKSTGEVIPDVTPGINSSIKSLSGGQPLSGAERSFFELRFGTDFSHVRKHTDARAASAAKSVNARAFTLGHNVVFAAGEYSSDSSAGKKLFAHELTHVVQQNGRSNKHSNTAGQSGSEHNIGHQEFSTTQTQHQIQNIMKVMNGASASTIQRRVYEGHDHGGRYEINDINCTFIRSGQSKNSL